MSTEMTPTSDQSSFTRAEPAGGEGAGVRFTDAFNGDNDALLRSIEALLAMDADGALVPHGIGGLARSLLGAAASRLERA